VQVIDINDNVPTFVYPESSKRYAKNAYFGAVSADEEIGSAVLQVKAEDLDGGKLGDVRYELADDDDQNSTEGPYFAVDPKTGIVKTLRTLTDVLPRNLPFRLVVTARDNPGATNPSDYNTAQAHVVVSVQKINLMFELARTGNLPYTSPCGQDYTDREYDLYFSFTDKRDQRPTSFGDGHRRRTSGHR